jgi:hypothetical protein
LAYDQGLLDGVVVAGAEDLEIVCYGVLNASLVKREGVALIFKASSS